MARMMVLGLMLVGAVAGCSSRIERPQLTVRVVDAVTGRPLPGVPVLHALQTILHCKKVIPSDRFEPRWISKAAGVTDERGEARIAVGEVSLDFNECVLGEQLLINVHVDMGAQRARDAAETLESRCRRESDSCAGPITEFDVAAMAFHSDCGHGVLSPQLKGYEGRKVLLAEPGRYEASSIASRCGGWLGSRLHETRRSEAETIVVALDPLKP